MLKRNSVNGHSNTNTARSAKVRTGWPYMLGEPLTINHYHYQVNCLFYSYILQTPEETRELVVILFL